MLCIAVWKFLSFYEAVSWDIFLRLFTIFCWITRNFITVFILKWSLNLFIDVFCVSVWKSLSFWSGNLEYLSLGVVPSSVVVPGITFAIFIFISCCNFFLRCVLYFLFVYFSFNNFVSWNYFSWCFPSLDGTSSTSYHLSYYYKFGIRTELLGVYVAVTGVPFLSTVWSITL